MYAESKPYRYGEARDLLRSIIEDFLILSGDKLGSNDVTWQDVAGTASVNLQVLASRLEAAREGNVSGGPAVFPSPKDLEDRPIKSITDEEYREAINDHMGWCPNCKEFTRDSTEPDAENYDCPECNENRVMGAEQALLVGQITIGEEG